MAIWTYFSKDLDICIGLEALHIGPTLDSWPFRDGTTANNHSRVVLDQLANEILAS